MLHYQSHVELSSASQLLIHIAKDFGTPNRDLVKTAGRITNKQINAFGKGRLHMHKLPHCTFYKHVQILQHSMLLSKHVLCCLAVLSGARHLTSFVNKLTTYDSCRAVQMQSVEQAHHF